MAESKRTGQRGSGRRFAESEKQQIVELALRGESPLRSIAREHGICQNTLRRWLARYRGETPNAHVRPRGRGPTASTTFLPIAIAGAAFPSRPNGSAVEITLASGMSVRIDGDRLDERFICALIAELRR